MKELIDIVAAFKSLCAQGKPAALATVVNVEGSAYRRPGARMLIAEDGRTWGGVSGGCLERDVAARGRGVIASGKPFLCRYDGGDEELISRGVATGCGGTIDVFVEPVTNDRPGPIHLIAAALVGNEPVRIATIIHDRESQGETFALADNQIASADAFVQTVTAPQRLVLIGGGPDVVPVLAIAKMIGWRVAVVAAPPATLLAERFALADERYVTSSDAPLAGVPVSPSDAVVVMTHNLARDGAVLAALAVRPRFLGVLGPQHRSDRLLANLPLLHPARHLRSPVGLDLGATSPEEIALSIIAGVQAAIRDASAVQLASRPAGYEAACGR